MNLGAGEAPFNRFAEFQLGCDAGLCGRDTLQSEEDKDYAKELWKHRTLRWLEKKTSYRKRVTGGQFGTGFSGFSGLAGLIL
jgi:hypothetical protein